MLTEHTDTEIDAHLTATQEARRDAIAAQTNATLTVEQQMIRDGYINDLHANGRRAAERNRIIAADAKLDALFSGDTESDAQAAASAARAEALGRMTSK